jgi:hypothetical protein
VRRSFGTRMAFTHCFRFRHEFVSVTASNTEISIVFSNMEYL